MASVCGGTMALLDAGIPISMPAAGVAVGLVSRPNQANDRDYQVLVDIMGLEDFLGDMDFKLAGTKEGITALQADIKLPGLPFAVSAIKTPSQNCDKIKPLFFKVVQESMCKGHAGISTIIDIMNNCISEPKASKSNWPVNKKLDVPVHKRGKFMGPGGINIKRLLVDTGVQVSAHPSEQGAWNLFAPNQEAMEEALETIETTMAEEKVPEFEFGAIYTVKIKEILERGIHVELHPEIPLVFINNAQLDARKV